ncbi:hypothetical protein [Abyssalbus ytuae]|uniref:Uncharacterized protein n=1 Tax=Abyssalbus ytuae TaxID=2926907 RepID=A0A9E6ZYS3_9FLAO|nr:hypothetical protein [Abyssalbus ytuae]UOB19441.1 hypothetical protein MQE35_09105 [Abyssalbus ytuae]
MNKEYTINDKLNASATAGSQAGRFLSGYLSYTLYFFIPFFLNKLSTVGLHVVDYTFCICKKIFFMRFCSEGTSVVGLFSTSMNSHCHGHNIPQGVIAPTVKNQKTVAASGCKINSILTILSSCKVPVSFNYPVVSLSIPFFPTFQS